jgi:hypothetical protein
MPAVLLGVPQLVTREIGIKNAGGKDRRRQGDGRSRLTPIRRFGKKGAASQ